MPITLITAPPGTGKTVYACRMMRDFLKETYIKEASHGVELIHRKLHVNGIRDLVIDHDLIDSPRPFQEWSEYNDPWSQQIRNPGDPPLDVPHFVDNWWLWCMPGDVIVVDECQRMFKPATPGRKLPRFITALEIHRHYGVDFLIITQNPNLINTNVRALVGTHYQLRRLPTKKGCMLYEFDRCAPQGQYRSAIATRFWRHSQQDYDSFKSAELHTKRRQSVPGVVIVLIVSLIALPFSLYYAYKAIAPKNLSPSGLNKNLPPGAVPASAVPGGGGAVPASAVPGGGGGVVPGGGRVPGGGGGGGGVRPVALRFINSIPKREFAPPEVVSCIGTTIDNCYCMVQTPAGFLRKHNDKALCWSVIVGDIYLQPGTEVFPHLVRTENDRRGGALLAGLNGDQQQDRRLPDQSASPANQ